jgi:hypothetical protein
MQEVDFCVKGVIGKTPLPPPCPTIFENASAAGPFYFSSFFISLLVSLFATTSLL